MTPQLSFALRYSRYLDMEIFLSKEPTSSSSAEESSITPPTVVPGLGYPNGRDEISPEPTGWQVDTTEITEIGKQVSRETSG
jgi:hypothetical protein